MKICFGELWLKGILISEMSVKQADGMPIIQALAMTVAEIPVFLYSTFGQVNIYACIVWFGVSNTQTPFSLLLDSFTKRQGTMTKYTFKRALNVCLFLFPVHIFPAKAYPKLEEGAVCHSTGQCSSGSYCSSAEKAWEKKEAGNTTKGGPEGSGDP